jgi:twitching motility protein PilJ
MINKSRKEKGAPGGGSRLWTVAIGVAVLGCAAVVAYGLSGLRREAAGESEYRVAAGELRQLSHALAQSARDTQRGEEPAFTALADQMAQFEARLDRIQNAGLHDELGDVESSWHPVRRAAQTLVDAGPRVVFVHDTAAKLEQALPQMQQELGAVADRLRARNAPAGTTGAAQDTLWLSERIARNADRVLAGGSNSQLAADEFRSDVAEFIRSIEALTRGNPLVGVEQVKDAEAIEAMSRAFRSFSVVSTSVDRFAGAAPDLRQAAAARRTLLDASAPLVDAVAGLTPALDAMATGRLTGRATVLSLFVAPALLAAGLMLALYYRQRQRVRATGQGLAQINGALQQIAGGDLAVQVPEDNVITAQSARQLNAATASQRELVRQIRMPFERSLEEIAGIGATVRDQVEKGVELTRSVVEATAAATEMVRISEEIKRSTAEAARTSERSSSQVAQGYALTKDMSKASADVRESVQETSKSAKRQSELIQSVTAAAEYIQALNTKISVVAINTRIEAEKAGEYGRPFLGIAESIADLLREAEEEGRKIISEVRMLQSMSAENLASMENTVGTVVTILEYVERLHGSLEEINAGSSAIGAIIRSVDEAAGQSAASAQHMNSSMARIRERNLEIGEFSESAQIGVTRLQQSMQEAGGKLGQYRIGHAAPPRAASLAEISELERNRPAKKVYREEEMTALEAAKQSRAMV